MTDTAQHLELLRLVATGGFGSTETLPAKHKEWPQLRPMLLWAVETIEAMAKKITELELEVALLDGELRERGYDPFEDQE